MAPAKSIFRVLRYLPVVAATAGICFLALKPSPASTDIPMVPLAVGRALDAEDFLCNVAGFLVLTVIVHATFAGWGRRRSVRRLGRHMAALGALVVGLECAQLFIPRRNFDWKDIAAGLLGVAIASLPWWKSSATPEPGMPAMAGAERRAE